MLRRLRYRHHEQPPVKIEKVRLWTMLGGCRRDIWKQIFLQAPRGTSTESSESIPFQLLGGTNCETAVGIRSAFRLIATSGFSRRSYA
jgi:hypothetical protein